MGQPFMTRKRKASICQVRVIDVFDIYRAMPIRAQMRYKPLVSLVFQENDNLPHASKGLAIATDEVAELTEIGYPDQQEFP